MGKKQIGINLVAGLISCAATLGVSFFLTPYLVAQLGEEAYGYVGLANQFVTIATVFTTALNSMANRFILLAYQKKNLNKVNEYYSSLFAGGLLLATVFLLVGLVVSTFVDRIFKITPALVPAVKVSFFLSVVNFSLMTLLSVFTSAAFICNRLALTSKGELTANVVKIVFLAGIFYFVSPQIYYVTLGGLIYTAVLYSNHFINTRRLLPELRIRLKLAKLKTVKELVLAGSWNSLNSVIQLLMIGLDLALANWLLDGRAMGLISIANTISVASNSILAMVIGIFQPVLFRTYATGDQGALKIQVGQVNRLQCAIMYVPIAGLMVFSPLFYTLWMPYKSWQDVLLLAGITAVKVWDQFAGLTANAIRLNFSMYNRLRSCVIAKLLCSVLNIPLVLLLVKVCPFYEGDVLIIAGVSSLLYSVYYWAMEPKLVSRITGEKIWRYYSMIAKEIVLFLCLIAAYMLIYINVKVPTDWGSFLVLAGIAGLLGYVITWAVGLSREDRAMFKEMIWAKFKAIQ